MISALMERDHRQLSVLQNNLRSALDEQKLTRAFELLDLFWARLAVHIRAENLCLFPRLLRAFSEEHRCASGVPTFDEVKTALETLRSDHNFFMDQLSKAVNTMRDAKSEDKSHRTITLCEEVRRIVAAVSERLSEHDRLEEERVYKWTTSLLNADELDVLRASLKRELENMPPRFTDAGS